MVHEYEKKARKMMSRLGLRPIPDITRATFKMSSGYYFIEDPDVYMNSNDSYVIFGEASSPAAQAQTSQAQAAMAQQQAAATKEMDVSYVIETVNNNTPELTTTDEGDNKVEGVDEKDIDLVISQASCTRAEAIVALKENNGDLVNAIMSLTV